jgi:hypothetical protein
MKLWALAILIVATVCTLLASLIWVTPWLFAHLDVVAPALALVFLVFLTRMLLESV